MTGVRGKSGRLPPDADREAIRRKAAMAEAAARFDRARESAPLDLAKAEFPVATWIDLKDHLECELKKEKLAAAKIESETLAAKRDVERGELLTREQVHARDDAIATAIRDGLGTVDQLLRDTVPAHSLLRAQEMARKWIDGVLTKVADAIEGGG